MMMIEKRDKSERRAETEVQENGNCCVVKHHSLYFCIACSFNLVLFELNWSEDTVWQWSVFCLFFFQYFPVDVPIRSASSSSDEASKKKKKKKKQNRSDSSSDEEERRKKTKKLKSNKKKSKKHKKEHGKSQKKKQKKRKQESSSSSSSSSSESSDSDWDTFMAQGSGNPLIILLFHENCGLQTLWEHGTQPCPAQVSFTRTEIYKRLVAPRADTAMKVKNVLERAHKAKELVPIYYFIFLSDTLSLHIWYLLCAEKLLVAHGALAEQFMEKSCRSRFPHAVLWVWAFLHLYHHVLPNWTMREQMLLLKVFVYFCMELH